jgi:stearoyl-CoA desaturase (delta-9 desaturase)
MPQMYEFLSLFVAFYIWHGLGITIGYHRLLSHRTFCCSKFVEYFFIAAGYLAFQGSPIMWATIHRAHHRYVDSDLDPHSPRYGFLDAYIGWIARKNYPAHIAPGAQSKDLINDPIYGFLEQNGNIRRGHELSYAINILFRIIIFACFGWMPALASLLAGMMVLQIPLMLNVLCHIPRLGYKNYAGIDDSVNVWLVGLLALGEGWHNNHHAFPGSARTGIRFFEFDLSWITIDAMAKIGLVSKVKAVTNDQLLQHSKQPESLRHID